MKKILLVLFGWLFLIGGVILAIVNIEHENDFAVVNLVGLVIGIVMAIIGFVMKNKARWICLKCGGKGQPVDVEYVGKDVDYEDTDSGYKKRISRKYLLHIQCAKCSNRWTLKTSKDTSERHSFK